MRLAGQELDLWQQDAVNLIHAVRADGKWACFEYGEIAVRQNGKGAIFETRALSGLFLLGDRLIMWSAHEYKTAMEAFRRMRWLFTNLGQEITPNLIDVDGVPIRVSNTNGEEGFERLDTGQRLKFIARSKGSGRGFSGDVNLIDEAFAYTEDQQEALMPTMNARENPQIIYGSTPPLDSLSGGPMFKLRERGESGEDESLGWRDWGLAGDLGSLDSIDLDDRRNWAATNPALGTRITEETLARLRRSMSDEGFAREILGVWPRRVVGAGWKVIREDLWRDLSDPTTERPTDVAFAVALDMARTHGAIMAVGPRSDGVMVVSVVDYRAGTAWIPVRLAELRERHDPVAIGLDPKGPAGSLILDLERHGIRQPDDPDRPSRGDLAIPAASDARDSYGMFVDAVNQRRLVHLDETPLTVAVAGAGTRTLVGGTTWERKGPVDISTLDAATTAHWAYVTRVAAVTSVYDPLANIG